MPTNPVTNIADELSIAWGNVAQSAGSLVTPTLRLGVTGLSRAGKTIFITSLIQHLLDPRKMSAFSPYGEGRFIGAQLVEHPDKTTPRFAYEQHTKNLQDTPPVWPNSTRQISQIRIALKFESAGFLPSLGGPSIMHLDIVDYPGEWLLDLPLLSQSYDEWATDALGRMSANPTPEAQKFLKALEKIDSDTKADEGTAERLSELFKAHLVAARHDKYALSTLPPGRFLMPGDLEGAPALTFAPLPADTLSGSALSQMMQRRFEAYKADVIRPFYRDHFARLDRQIVLVDALRALNAGPHAVSDLETALTSVLKSFRLGKNSPWNWLVARRIDKVLFAATKADHVHHTNHNRLEKILSRLLGRAAHRAQFSRTVTKSLAIASVRATKEGEIKEDGETFDCLIGTPQSGEILDGTTYSGEEEIALFPGDLPESSESVFQDDFKAGQLNFLRFNPPPKSTDGPLPHIRLDQAVDFLIADWMK